MRRPHIPTSLRLALSCALAGAALAFAGCGGGSSALSLEEWQTQVNAMCTEVQERLGEQAEALPDDPENAEVAQLLERALPEYRTFLQGLEELGPPEGEEERYSEVLEQRERVIDLTEQAAEALRDDDEQRARRAFGELEKLLLPESIEVFRELALDDCVD